MQSKIGPLILIVIGAVFLAANLGLFSIHDLGALTAKYWPVILIAVGAIGLLTGRK
jgi:Flp pilus assembly protein protease CpaA